MSDDFDEMAAFEEEERKLAEAEGFKSADEAPPVIQDIIAKHLLEYGRPEEQERAKEMLQQQRRYEREAMSDSRPKETLPANRRFDETDDELREEWEHCLRERMAAMNQRRNLAARHYGQWLFLMYREMWRRGFTREELDQRISQWTLELIAEKQLVPPHAISYESLVPVKQRSYRLYADDHAVTFSTFQIMGGGGFWQMGTTDGLLWPARHPDEQAVLNWATVFFIQMLKWINIAGNPVDAFVPDLVLDEVGFQHPRAEGAS